MIDDLREEIDRIDEKLVELMSRRASKGLKIGRYKKENSRDITDKEREQVVLNRVKKLNSGPFKDEQIERIYRQLISETKELEEEVDTDDSSDEA